VNQKSPLVQIPKLLNFYRDCILKLDELIAETYQLYEVNQGHAGIEAVRSCGLLPADPETRPR
jgi:Zn-dependent alcohol dehydrogenase